MALSPAARVSARSGARSVAMYCLEGPKEMPCSNQEAQEALDDGVSIHNGWGPKEILTEDGKVTGIVFKKCLNVYEGKGKFAPKYDEDETVTVKCDRVIFAIGQCVQWGELLKDTAVKLGRGGYPEADSLTFQTAQPDIFVGGDVYTGPKFAIDAIAQGHYAAESLHRYVHNAHMTIGRNRWEFIELDKDNIRVESYDNSSRQREGTDRSKGPFRDASVTLTEEQVRIETARCLGCGAVVVDPNKCIGCGVCTTRCGFDAIHLHRDRPECTHMVKAEEKFKYILPYAAKRAAKIAVRKVKK